MSMTKQEALKRLHEIVDGIDKDEVESSTGWWETSKGADFGSERLRLLEELVSEMSSE